MNEMEELSLDLLKLISISLSNIDLWAWSMINKHFNRSLKKVQPFWLNKRIGSWEQRLKVISENEKKITYHWFSLDEKERLFEGLRYQSKKIVSRERNLTRSQTSFITLSLDLQAFQHAYRKYPSPYINLITKEETVKSIIPILWVTIFLQDDIQPYSIYAESLHLNGFNILWYNSKLKKYFVTEYSPRETILPAAEIIYLDSNIYQVRELSITVTHLDTLEQGLTNLLATTPIVNFYR